MGPCRAARAGCRFCWTGRGRGGVRHWAAAVAGAVGRGRRLGCIGHGRSSAVRGADRGVRVGRCAAAVPGRVQRVRDARIGCTAAGGVLRRVRTTNRSGAAGDRHRPDAGWADGPVARTGGWSGAGPGGRRRREPFGETGSGAGAQPWETGAGPSAPVADTGVSASGRRHLREPGRGPEPWDTSGGTGTAGGRPLREPFGERGPVPESYGRPVGEHVADDPGGRRRRDAGERGDELISGTGGRRRLREPGPTRPVRDGSPTEPGRRAERSGQRRGRVVRHPGVGRRPRGRWPARPAPSRYRVRRRHR